MKILIVGAGPAGLITGLNLIEKGFKPLILERQKEIKSTACAEGVDIRSLEQIPFDSAPFISKKIRKVKCIYPNNASFHADMQGVILNRTQWLQGMASKFVKRGGALELDSKVVATGQGHIHLETGEKIGYDRLIGADGPGSVAAKHIGVRHETVLAVQYNIEYNTIGLNALKIYLNRRCSPEYCWVFPKEKSINVGLFGKFEQLDEFLKLQGFEKNKIIKKEAGLIPVSGTGKLFQGDIALIGDAAGMVNPMTCGGLTIIAHAARILADNISDLERYASEVKKHPMSNPVCLKARKMMLSIPNEDLNKMGTMIDGQNLEEMSWRTKLKMLRYPRMVPKIYLFGRAFETAIRWGW